MNENINYNPFGCCPMKYQIYLLLAMLIVIFLLIPNNVLANDTSSITREPTSYSNLVNDLAQMKGFFRGGKTGKNKMSFEPVTFNSKAAKAAGFSKESISLAEEIAGFSNHIVDNQQQSLRSSPSGFSSESFANVTTFDYPKMERFFELAKDESLSTDIIDEEPKVAEMNGWLCSLSPQCTCGSYGNPRPSRSKDRVFFEVSNAEETLRTWGYHPPFALEGEGWTRPRTYKWLLCGFETFRDNAYPVSTTELWEQNYAGWEPNGEPNPEVYRSGPWPYPDWPAYVFWWHQIYNR